MVVRYIPRAGDVIWLDFDPQAGREQSKRRPALVVTDQAYNQASGLAVVCPLTSRRKPYPFALPVTVAKIEGAVLVDHLQSLDWTARNASFHSKADPALLAKIRAYLGVLLGIR
ncbi:MAG TPA: type II toxin-antitoxin system PemK/MazF family toxin [Candidatus Sulfotelmatobacter sp.]|nr:type II toxin-antitoxin system PemK/MazF family toxin [Candidatus Sulfotelmatobacter sp.]